MPFIDRCEAEVVALAGGRLEIGKRRERGHVTLVPGCSSSSSRESTRCWVSHARLTELASDIELEDASELVHLPAFYFLTEVGLRLLGRGVAGRGVRGHGVERGLASVF